MNIIDDMRQGSEAWHQFRACHFGASEAPAMMGESKFKSRNQLLHEKSTGIVPEVDAATQRRFDDGHRAEELARGLAEAMINDDLYPVTGEEGKLSASFDGLTLDQLTAWEHKLLNDTLRACDTAADLPICYRIQMEQCMMLSGAERCLFSTTKWDYAENLIEEKHLWYTPDHDLRDRLMQGWTQFAIDLENYQHIEHIPAAVATPTRDLPALSIQVQGSISLIDNLSVFGERLKTFVAEIDMNPSDDQGFANAEAAVKTLQAAQDALESAEASALAQTSSIDEMRKTVKLYADTARTTRLMLEKMVKARKESIRIEIVHGGKYALDEHIATLNARLVKPYMPTIAADFAGVIKGKKNIASLHDAVATELARCKIEANAIADRIQINLNSLRELAKDHAFLFSDTSQLVMKQNDDLVALIKVRIAEHQHAEAAKLEAERASIQAEEQAKAKSAQDALLAAERAKMEAEVRAKAEEEAARIAQDQSLMPTVRTIAEDREDAAATIEERRKQAQLDAQAKPFNARTRPCRQQMIDCIAATFRVAEHVALDWILQEFCGEIYTKKGS